MQAQPTRRSNLFLLELIFAILFFSLAATVCVRFFIKSRTLEEESSELNHAITRVTSVAEIFRNEEDPYACLETQFPLGEYENNRCLLYFSENWDACTSSEAVYTLELKTSTENRMFYGQICMRDAKKDLYTLNVEKYLKGEVASE